MSKLKYILKNNRIVTSFYKGMLSFIYSLIIKFSPGRATRMIYKRKTGKTLNLDEPRDLNEKIQWLKLYWQHPFVTKCGDKYEVRNYAEEIGCAESLIDLYGVYDNAVDIPWQELPQKFVLKVTGGCGFNIICKDKSKLNKTDIEKQLNKWLKTDFGLKEAEIHYSKMKSRIICEKFMETKSGSLPIDYKIYCFNGKPQVVLVAVGRESKVKRLMFDLDWNQIDFIKGESPEKVPDIKKPKSFNDMIYYAKKLSKPFPFVRIDFYDYDGKAILGEMTFTPNAGMATYYKEGILLELGKMIQLPEKISQ